jgi:hypothetical protein
VSEAGGILDAVNVFVSSVVRGLEPYRDAAADAARILDHQVKRSEDFGPSGMSPQQACLAGVRWADVVVLLLGDRYGEPQQSGLSATHEEYREAREGGVVLPFLREGIEPEPSQKELIDEVRGWSGGLMAGSFSSAEELKEHVIRALRDVELTRQSGRIDEDEMLERARRLLSEPQRPPHAVLTLAVAAGPKQPVLRPAQIEAEPLRIELQQAAMFGPFPVLDKGQATSSRIEEATLVLQQPEASVSVTQLGSLRITQRAEDDDREGLPVLIEEVIQGKLSRALSFAGSVLDSIDPSRRLTHVAPMVGLLGGGYLGWRTQAEHARSPQTVQYSRAAGEEVIERLQPGSRPRAALLHQAAELAEDFTTVLRRRFRT